MNYFDLDLIKEMMGENKIEVKPSAMSSEQQRHWRILIGKPNYLRLDALVQQRWELVENYSKRLIPDDLFTQTLEMYENAIKEELIL